MAAPNAALQLVKMVDGAEEHRGLTPGQSVTYRLEFSAENYDVDGIDGKVTLTDVLPAEFEGWKISKINANLPNNPDTVTVSLPGVAVPAGGTIGSGEANRTITIDIKAPVDGGGTGLPTGAQGWLTYTVIVPSTLTPEWEANHRELINEASITGLGGAQNSEITVDDSALITVDVATNVGVKPTKTWSPGAQGYDPGAASNVTIGATNESNVHAKSLVLQVPKVAADGATELDESNPFRYVDFAGFSSDPTAPGALPAGATAGTVEVYVFDESAGTWSWKAYTGSAQNPDVAGVRLSYTGEITPGASVNAGFGLIQREADRAGKIDLTKGYTAKNALEATVTPVTGDPVSKGTDATLVVSPLSIKVAAGKSFSDSSGNALNPLTTVAGNSVNATLTAKNMEAPTSATLKSLSITEPAAGSHAKYFSNDLAFGGFDQKSAEGLWPEGATGGTITWKTADGDTKVTLTAGQPLPAVEAPLTNADITGFVIEYTGKIAPGAVSQVKYKLDTDKDVAPEGATVGPFKNVIDVDGTRVGVDPAHAEADASLNLVAPKLVAKIEKNVGPGVVYPGDDVVVQLPANVQTQGDKTKTTKIEVADKFDGAGTFWDAFDVKAVLAPIDVPTGSTLTIQRFDSTKNEWVDVSTLTGPSADDIVIAPADTTTGIKFVYTDANGFGQETDVKPNLSFTARKALRSDSAKTTTPAPADKPEALTVYKNTATVHAEGDLEGRPVKGDDSAKADATLRPDTNRGPGGLWADKKWNKASIVTQADQTATTKQLWSVSKTGYSKVELSDPVTPSADGAGTVFDEFNLTKIHAITAANDPMLKWDVVSKVELYNGTAWVTVPAPTGGWMKNNGFVGYDLTPAQQASTLGVKLTVEPNVAARTAAAAKGDLTAPKATDGVASSAATRSYELGWQLRDKARTGAWVVSGNTFNCADSAKGCVNNTFGVTGVADSGNQTAKADDSIVLLDATPNVSLEKTVGGLANNEAVNLVVPNYGEVDASQYPTTYYTLTAKNSAGSSPVVAKLGKLRVTDQASSSLGKTDMGVSPFDGRDFAGEAKSPEGNSFDTFNLTKLSFVNLPAYIDKQQSTVEVWLYNGGATTTKSYSITEAQALTAKQLADVIGVSVTYQGTDPETNGNKIVAGNALTMKLDVQLRDTYRVSGEHMVGGTKDSSIPVLNTARALGQDLVIDPKKQPAAVEDAQVNLTEAVIDVQLHKKMALANGATEITEPEPDAPLNVTIAATPGNSTAPLRELTIEDTTPAFWEKFEFVSFAKGTAPTDANVATHQLLTDNGWEAAEAVTDLTQVKGARVIFTRDGANAGDNLFPVGATSWAGKSWTTAGLNFQVKLRADADINWGANLEIENTANTAANGKKGEPVTAKFGAGVSFSKGDHKIKVQKRAPGDDSDHIVESMVSNPWQLIFSNEGSGYLPIKTVTDHLPSKLEWDGIQPTIKTSAGGTLPIDAKDVKVEYSTVTNDIVFTWADDARMKPKEEVTITLGLALKPGLSSMEKATNIVDVETGVQLAATEGCQQPTTNGQLPGLGSPLTGTNCSNTNFVQAKAGTLIGAQKFVNGEAVDTLGENLVTGAMSIKNPEAADCVTPGAPSDYTRTECAEYTAVGATDNWKLRQVNAGTTSLNRMVIIDMLPIPGDILMVGGPAPRNSTFRPVIDLDSIVIPDLPKGASATIEVTTNPAACVGDGSTASLWTKADPFCENTTLNPANGSWVKSSDFNGNNEDIAGFRVNVAMKSAPLAPGEEVNLSYNTVNRVVDQAAEGLKPTLAQFATPQFAWNQSGVFAWDTADKAINLVKAPQPAGVTVKTGKLEVSKKVIAPADLKTPESFVVDLKCTVPSGLQAPAAERVALDLGAYATLTLPADGTAVTVPGLPIGTDCEITEDGVLGSYGEIERGFEATDGVTAAADGSSATIKIREPRAGDEATIATLTNTYEFGEISIEKNLVSVDDNPLGGKVGNKSFDFTLTCTVNGVTDKVVRDFTLKAGGKLVITDVPQGANCVLVETNTGGAVDTAIALDTVVTEGTTLEGIVIGDKPQHAIVTNGFPGDPSTGGTGGGPGTDEPGLGGEKDPNGSGDGLSLTGSDIAGISIAAGVLLLVGAAALLLARRRRSAN